ncbi:MAG: hypothetical protein ACOC38_10995 [Promethearchaeia archaeon]
MKKEMPDEMEERPAIEHSKDNDSGADNSTTAAGPRFVTEFVEDDIETGEVLEVSLRELVDLPSTSYATFGIYKYPAKFIPQIPVYVLERYAEDDMTVFDPFAGCGTTGLVSRLYGLEYELWDLNPILDLLHRVAIAPPQSYNVDDLINRLSVHETYYHPEWANFDYWFAEPFKEFLKHVWGSYHEINDTNKKELLAVPLLNVSRYFSYDDMGRMKLSKSPKSEERVENILKKNWKALFYSMLKKEITDLLERQEEYHTFNPRDVDSIIHAGIDSLNYDLGQSKDILVTSPPYMQSQEYMRQAKMDLFWLGYSDEDVRILSRKEIPYRDISETDIYSQTYKRMRRGVQEDHIQDVYDNYFRGVTMALQRLSEDINSFLFFFVGRPSMRGRPVPIDEILTEHFTELGWVHKGTLVDTIVSRRMFSYGVNPATNMKDNRSSRESLVVLKRN